MACILVNAFLASLSLSYPGCPAVLVNNSCMLATTGLLKCVIWSMKLALPCGNLTLSGLYLRYGPGFHNLLSTNIANFFPSLNVSLSFVALVFLSFLLLRSAKALFSADICLTTRSKNIFVLFITIVKTYAQ